MQSSHARSYEKSVLDLDQQWNGLCPLLFIDPDFTLFYSRTERLLESALVDHVEIDSRNNDILAGVHGPRNQNTSLWWFRSTTDFCLWKTSVTISCCSPDCQRWSFRRRRLEEQASLFLVFVGMDWRRLKFFDDCSYHFCLWIALLLASHNSFLLWFYLLLSISISLLRFFVSASFMLNVIQQLLLIQRPLPSF